MGVMSVCEQDWIQEAVAFDGHQDRTEGFLKIYLIGAV